jgi:hypothetical protein
MKAARIIKMSAIAVGMGAALMCTASVKAQEITNTDWANPNTVAFDKQATATAAQAQTPAAAQSASAPVKAVAESAVIGRSSVSREDALVLGSLAICTGLALYVLPKSKRDRKRWNARAATLTDQASLS